MAIWQCVIELIPQAWAEIEGNVPEMLRDGEGYYDMSRAWKQNQPSVNLVDLIAQILPPTESWSETIRIFGDQAKSDVQVSYSDNAVESLQFRIDTREETSHMCLKIVELARALGCFLFLPEASSIIMAEVAALNYAVHNSRAARFSAEPRDFMERLGRVTSRES